jgi:hypothetical protein
MVRCLRLDGLLLGVLVVALLVCGDLRAYPWMSRHEYTGCATCHSDPSGGGLLTPYGRSQGDLLLAMQYSAAAESAEPSGEPLWGLLSPPDWLLVGGSYRHMTLFDFGDRFATFPMQADLYGEVRFQWLRASGSIGVAKVAPSSRFARRAQITRNQGDELNLISRYHWLGADIAEFTVRAGRLEIPFGVRIPEHTMWVRSETRTDRESAQQHGVALAYTGEWLRGEVMAILGNYQLHPDELRERGYSGYVEAHAARGVDIGVSSLVTHAAADFQSLETDATRHAHGVFARLVPWAPLAVLAEADLLWRSHHDAGYVGFTRVDYEIVQGLHLGVTGEILDAGYRDTGDPYNTTPLAPGFGRPRLGGWLTVDWFFLPQLEARLDGVLRQSDRFTLLAQLHAFL